MRVLGWILKKFFGSKEEHYWLAIPKYVDSEKEKKELIQKYKKFINDNIILKIEEY